MSVKRTELAIAMSSSAGLELFWSVVAFGSALFALASPQPLALAAFAAVASAFALLARSGELAARWPRSVDKSPRPETVGLNLIAAICALALGSLAFAGIAPHILVPIALLLLGGLLVLDAPLEPELAAPRGVVAGGYMILASVAAIIMVAIGFSARANEPSLVPWAALLIASAQLVGAAAVLVRFGRNTLTTP